MKETFVATMLALASTAAFAQASAPIKIGVVTPLSGTYAGIGQQVKWGLDLAQINAGGGVMGRKLELIYEDEEANPAVATQKAEKLFQVNKVDFLTGTVNSGSTLAVGQVAERNNRLIATTVSFADSITADKCSPNVFRVNARAGMQSAALADWMATTQKDASAAAPWPRSGARPKARARRPLARCSRRSTTRTIRPTSARSAAPGRR
jgi:branched-chain amino acid transport system substrate-binding protein